MVTERKNSSLIWLCLWITILLLLLRGGEGNTRLWYISGTYNIHVKNDILYSENRFARLCIGTWGRRTSPRGLDIIIIFISSPRLLLLFCPSTSTRIIFQFYTQWLYITVNTRRNNSGGAAGGYGWVGWWWTKAMAIKFRSCRKRRRGARDWLSGNQFLSFNWKESSWVWGEFIRRALKDRISLFR